MALATATPASGRTWAAIFHPVRSAALQQPLYSASSRRTAVAVAVASMAIASPPSIAAFSTGSASSSAGNASAGAAASQACNCASWAGDQCGSVSAPAPVPARASQSRRGESQRVIALLSRLCLPVAIVRDQAAAPGTAAPLAGENSACDGQSPGNAAVTDKGAASS